MSENHPFLSPDFHIQWSQLTAERVAPETREGIEQARQALAAIKLVTSDSACYESTFGALEAATEPLQRAWGRLNHLDSVANNDAQRAALNELLPEVSQFFSSISLDGDLWQVLKAFAESPKAKNLSAVQARFVEETCHDFRSSGADLPDQEKSRIAEVNSELASLTQKFSENVLDSTNSFELYIEDEARLAGLPGSAKAAAAEDAAAKGKEGAWRFTLQMPSMLPVLQHAEDDELRREIWTGSSMIASGGDFDNSELIWDILKLRKEKAELLGQSHFADMVTERRMAQTGGKALSFVEDLHDRILEKFEKEAVELESYKAGQTGGKAGPLEPWEVAFWSEKQRQELYDFDDEVLRPYFSVDKVMEGMFAITSRLFGIEIAEKDSIYYTTPQEGQKGQGEAVEVWHAECKFYEIHDGESGDHLGSFYADWHPRETKRGGAWMNCLEAGLPPISGQPRQPHLGLIMGNMTKPVGDQPALLTHSEVETIFHEFGHLLHQLLSEVEVKSLSGTNVPWDFVELPSQIMENFCWDRESLDFFARHYESGEVIPEELFQKMLAARNYRSATFFMRQLSLGKLDLELHVNTERYLGRNLEEIDQEILSSYHIPLARTAPSRARSFNHLFSSPVGYAAGYYSYKWAEVLDADAFTRFQKEGVLNAETGRAFREAILARGNSRPVEESYRDFMGRDPDLQPLLVRNGLA